MKTSIHLREDQYTVTWRPVYIYMKTSIHLHEDQYTFTMVSRWILLRMGNISEKSCREIKTYVLLSIIFFENHPVYEMMWRSAVEADNP